MKDIPVLSIHKIERLWRFALSLAFITIIYNIAEGFIATWFGYEEDALTLFGFGVDSFIETISGIGIAHMIFRIKKQPDHQIDKFEMTALRVTGVAFYVLSLGLLISIIFNLYTGSIPHSTIPGLIISSISIVVMAFLVYGKEKVGKALNSEPIIADARCTRTCIYMSIVLLASSAIYAITGLAYIDIIGTLGIVWFSYSEGKECFEKAKNKEISCSCGPE